MSTRYVIHGQNRATGETVRAVIDAGSIAEAEQQAQARGISVRAVEREEPGAEGGTARSGSSGGAARAFPDDVPSGGPASRGPERVVWEGTPSQWNNFPWFLACLLVLPIPVALWKMLLTSTTKIRITSERLRIETGIFNKKLEEIEHYRIKDTGLRRSFWQRLVGLGTVELMTSDASMPRVLLAGLKDAAAVREHVRQQVEAVRRARGVRELDVS